MPCELLDDEGELGGTSTKERFVAHDMYISAKVGKVELLLNEQKS
tara:strand:+ start:297 stop:431 length:135 start_codon:yes stop_codon:yes gene_type:complete